MSEEKVSPLQNPELPKIVLLLEKIPLLVPSFGFPTTESYSHALNTKTTASRPASLLLDSCCNHKYKSFLQASRLGVNPFANNGRAADAKFRRGLGYGHLDESAGPIVTINFNETRQQVFLFPQYQ
ncbi:hypothetical protein KL934_004965 [Ogataea polymorpha]|nr:hypothetical protein KL934_004965 [Ogataea polymorpha]